MGTWAGTSLPRIARAALAPTLPTLCGRCGRIVDVDDAWDVGHIIDRSVAPELAADPDNWRVEHRRCNRSAGGKAGRAKQLAGTGALVFTSRRW